MLVLYRFCIDMKDLSTLQSLVGNFKRKRKEMLLNYQPVLIPDSRSNLILIRYQDNDSHISILDR